MRNRPQFAWKYKNGNIGVKPSKLPSSAYESDLSVLDSYAKPSSYEWCRTCTHEIRNEKVVKYSIQKFGEVKCWNCQNPDKV